MSSLSGEALEAASRIYRARKRYETDMRNFCASATDRTTRWEVEAMSDIRLFLTSRRADADKVCASIDRHGLFGPFMAHDDESGEDLRVRTLKSWHVWDGFDNCMTPPMTRVEAQHMQWCLNWLWALSYGA